MKQSNRTVFSILLLPLLAMSGVLLFLAAAPLPNLNEDKLILHVTNPAMNSVVTNPFHVRGEMYSESNGNALKDTVAYAYTSYTFDEILTNENEVSTNKKYVNGKFKQLKAKSGQFDILIDLAQRDPADVQFPDVTFTFGDSEKTYPLDIPYRLTVVFTNE